MKLKSMLMLVAVIGSVLISKMSSAQGIAFVSDTNTDGASISSFRIGDLLGIPFTTGTNAGGYILDSIALLLATNPNATNWLTEAQINDDDGTVNNLQGTGGNIAPPADGGYDIFMPDSLGNDTAFLAPNTTYTVVFQCNVIFFFGDNPAPLNVSDTTAMPIGIDGWSYNYYSQPISFLPIFYITATPVEATPEPSVLTFIGLAGLMWRYRAK